VGVGRGSLWPLVLSLCRLRGCCPTAAALAAFPGVPQRLHQLQEHAPAPPVPPHVLQAGYPVVLLQQQYRMHPAISAFPASFFYGGKLLDAPAVLPDAPGGGAASGRSAPWHARAALPPLAFWDCREGREAGGGGGGSVSNAEEAEVAYALYEGEWAAMGVGAAGTRELPDWVLALLCPRVHPHWQQRCGRGPLPWAVGGTHCAWKSKALATAVLASVPPPEAFLCSMPVLPIPSQHPSASRTAAPLPRLQAWLRGTRGTSATWRY
jgi:hypothetical protein